jgi:hypothetical protein
MGYPDPDAVIRLAELGETETAYYATRIIALNSDQAEINALRDAGAIHYDLLPFFDFLAGEPDPLASGLSALQHISDTKVGDWDTQDPDVREMANLLAFGYQFASEAYNNPIRPVVDNWLLSAAATRPIANLCRQRCPEAPNDCAFSMLALTGGYYEVIRLDTPAETVISQDQFHASPRAQMMAMRRAAHSKNDLWELVASIDETAQMSQCFADIVSAERG